MAKLAPDVVATVLSRFVFGGPSADYLTVFDSWKDNATAISSIVTAFRSNLRSAISVGSVPFKLTHTAVQERRFGHVYSAERIRQLNFEDITDKERDKRALDLARQRYSERQKEPEFQESVRDEIVHSLHQALSDAEFNPASDELLRQVTVMVWGAFEVLATDMAIAVLNRLPILAGDVLAGEAFKRTGASKGIPVETLQDFDFDLSHSMGVILLGERRLDSMPTIASVCENLYKNSQLDAKLKSTNLWTLAQRHHLIVHRRGVVDAQYLSKTPDKMPLGHKITISSQEIDAYLLEVRDAGLLIAELADRLIASTDA